MTSPGPLRELERLGLLLLTDPLLPSLAGIVAGKPVRGSWWGHPRGHAIFRAAGELADHPDALLVRFLSGKLTYVHRRLWPDFLAVATSEARWRTRGLSPPARRLLSRIRQEGLLRPDRPGRGGKNRSLRGAPVRELENRLLIHTREIHTESGTHVKILQTWELWAAGKGLRPGRRREDSARARLEKMVGELNRRYGCRAWLPWSKG